MKEMYKSPVITVEELAKADVLCASDNGVALFSNALYSNDIFSVVSGNGMENIL